MLKIATLATMMVTAGSAFAFDQTCRDKLIKAGEIGLIQDMQVSGEGVIFIVDEDIFRGMAYVSKQGLVDTINCGMLDAGKRFNPMIFRSHRSNREIGRDEWGTLTVE